jgi:enoyl-CoA hydratase/carnithine racemase
MTETLAGKQTSETLYAVEDGIARITLNRPQGHNAWTLSMEEEYFDLLEQAAADRSVRVIVLSASGSVFCPGYDMTILAEVAASGASEYVVGRRPQTFPLSIPKPIVCSINGACAGIGLVQALMCDVRFAVANAKITTSFSRRGLIAEHGTSWLLPRIVGLPNALDLLISGRVILADEALGMGLVNFVAPADELAARATAYARDLADNASPTSMMTIKSQVYRHSAAVALSTALEESDELMRASFERPDFDEGISSFRERRAPRFLPIGGE